MTAEVVPYRVLIERRARQFFAFARNDPAYEWAVEEAVAFALAKYESISSIASANESGHRCP